MAEFPAMPVFIDALMLDTDHLTDAEFGLYCRFLFRLWVAPNRRFPNDDQWLARKFRMKSIEITNLLRPLIKEFCSVDGNWVTQARLTREWQYVATLSKRRSDSAKRMWEKKKALSSTDATLYSPAYAPTPTPTPTLKKDSSSNGAKTNGHAPTDWPPDYEKQFWDLYPLKKGKKAAFRKLEITRKSVPWASVLAGLQRYHNYALTQDTKFVKHPATWLNAGCWDDEYQSPKLEGFV